MTFFLASAYHVYLAVLVEQVLLLVAGHPITLSELEQESRLFLAGFSANGMGIEAANVPLDDEIMCKTLRTLVIQYVIEAEANRLSVPAAKPKAVQKALSGLKMHFSGEADFQNFMQKLELTSTELSAILSRRVRVDLMMQNRGSRVQIDEEQVAEHFGRYPGRFKDMREAYIDLLRSETTEVMQSWFEELFTRHTLRHIKVPDGLKSSIENCQIDIHDLLGLAAAQEKGAQKNE